MCVHTHNRVIDDYTYVYRINVDFKMNENRSKMTGLLTFKRITALDHDDEK